MPYLASFSGICRPLSPETQNCGIENKCLPIFFAPSRLCERLFVLTIEENQESREGAKTQRRAGHAWVQ
jgi:hypothetical protein